MQQGLIAQQVSFTRSAAPGTYQIHFQGLSVGEVRKAGSNWIVVDEAYSGATREDAAAAFIVANNLFVEAKPCQTLPALSQ